MPRVYDFKCSDCDEIHEYLVMKPDDNPLVCKGCSSTKAKFNRQVCYPKHFYGMPNSSDNAHSDTWRATTKSGNGYE